MSEVAYLEPGVEYSIVEGACHARLVELDGLLKETRLHGRSRCALTKATASTADQVAPVVQSSLVVTKHVTQGLIIVTVGNACVPVKKGSKVGVQAGTLGTGLYLWGDKGKCKMCKNRGENVDVGGVELWGGGRGGRP